MTATGLALPADKPTPTVGAPLLEIENLQVHFPIKDGIIFQSHVGDVRAVNGINLVIHEGETVGLVGESGCGKTTTGRCILKLEQPTSGSIRYRGKDIAQFDKAETFDYRRRVQAVFQDPYSSLNPRMSVGDIIAEPMVIHAVGGDFAGRARRVGELLDKCGLPRSLADRYPHEMSGGQRQRVGIARALALNPEFIVCDEAVSALDVSIQAQIIRLLEDLRDDLGLTYLFIGHDLSVVRHMCHRVAVMYLGHLVEMADCDRLFEDPRHPYTRALLTAVPIPDPDAEVQRSHDYLTGEVPSPINPPPGCVFNPRCSLADADCRRLVPPLIDIGDAQGQHMVACPKTT
jgi:oligopeptide transport system ATP-binding protein